MHLRTGNVDEAVRRFEFAIAIDPANWDARDQLVRSLIEARRYDEAIDRQKTLVAERPECGDLRLQLGDLYHKVGQEQEPLGQYQRALELNPDYLEAITKIGTCRLRMGELAAAAEGLLPGDRTQRSRIGCVCWTQRGPGRGGENGTGS